MVSQSAKALNTSQLLYWSLFFNEDIAVQALLFQFPRFIHPLFSLCAFDLFYSFSVRSKDRKSIFLFLLYSFSLFSLFLFSLLLSPLSSLLSPLSSLLSPPLVSPPLLFPPLSSPLLPSPLPSPPFPSSRF